MQNKKATTPRQEDKNEKTNEADLIHPVAANCRRPLKQTHIRRTIFVRLRSTLHRRRSLRESAHRLRGVGVPDHWLGS